MLRFGPDTGPVALVALPLFEEANRTRAFAVTICRMLAKRGVASVLPDLPGQGESSTKTDAASLDGWREGFSAAAAEVGVPHVLAIRSGCLLDTAAEALSRWHLSPITGAGLFAEMMRAAHLAAAPTRIDYRLHAVPEGPPVPVLGNLVARRTLLALDDAGPVEIPPRRTIRLAGDPAPADRHVPGAPLWRRAEPDNDPALAALLADDIARWMVACEG